MNNSEISLRRAGVEDGEALVDLSLQLGYEVNGSEMQERLAVMVAHSEHCIFVVEWAGEIAGWVHGFVAMRVESEFFVEIGGLVVDERRQKHGVGRILVEEVIKWAEERGLDKIRVRCNVLREDSHEFYRRVGFEEKKGQLVFDRGF